MKPRKVRVRLAIAGLGLAFALRITTHSPAASQASPAPAGPPVIYHKSRSFRVPFHFDPAERARRRELQLWVSDDLGRNWKQRGVTTPDRPAFTFSAEHDGEYWLAVRSLDNQGRLFPADDARIEPSMKVIVDTTPPSIVLEPQARSASLASVRWEVRDDNPDDAHPPVLQYQVDGSSEWLPVPLDEPGLLGVATWDTGFTDPVKVRATAMDRAGNKAETTVTLGSSKPGQPPLVATEGPKPSQTNEPKPATPPDQSIASNTTQAPAPPSDLAQKPARVATNHESAPTEAKPTGQVGAQKETAAQAVPSVQGGQIPGRAPVASVYPSSQDVAHRGTMSSPPPPAAIEPTTVSHLPTGLAELPAPIVSQIPSAPPAATRIPPEFEPTVPKGLENEKLRVEGIPGPELEVPRVGSVQKPESSNRQLLPGLAADPGVGTTAMSDAAGRPGGSDALQEGQVTRLKVPAPKFLLDYAVDRAGPDGRPAVIELWVTVDGGKSWNRKAEDPDRVSPIMVDLGAPGTYGINLVARDSNGLGDKPPAPGEAPKMWIEVESVPQRESRTPSLLQRVLRR